MLATKLLDQAPKNLPTPSKALEKLSEYSKVLEAELEWRKENERCSFYEPNGKLEGFLKHIGHSNRILGIVSAANGIGKTSMVANLLANLIWGPQNKYFDHPLFKDWKYPKRARYVTDPKLVEEIGPLHSEILKWWPKGQFEAIKSGKQYYSQYKANGWVIDVMTYDQDVRQFEGGTLGLVICDEPPPRSIWHASISRLRLGGMLLVFMTPLTEAAWFFDEVVPNHQESITYASMEDACKQHGVRGHLEHDRIQAMIQEMDPDEVEARAYGKAMYLKGLVFKTFDYNVHVAKKPISVPEYAEVWQIVDPHVDKPFACIWGYAEDDGTFYQIAEWPNEDFYRMHGCDLGVEDYKRIFKSKELGWNMKKRIIDHHFADIRSLQTKRTLREDFYQIGFNFDPSYTASEEIETGILKVRDYLKFNPNKPIDSLNRPRYIVSPTCANTIKGFQRWSFDTKSGKVKDEYKDFMDCVRYALMANPRRSFTPPDSPSRKLYG